MIITSPSRTGLSGLLAWEDRRRLNEQSERSLRGEALPSEIRFSDSYTDPCVSAYFDGNGVVGYFEATDSGSTNSSSTDVIVADSEEEQGNDSDNESIVTQGTEESVEIPMPSYLTIATEETQTL